jgi:hypothetical protein
MSKKYFFQESGFENKIIFRTIFDYQNNIISTTYF